MHKWSINNDKRGPCSIFSNTSHAFPFCSQNKSKQCNTCIDFISVIYLATLFTQKTTTEGKYTFFPSIFQYWFGIWITVAIANWIAERWINVTFGNSREGRELGLLATKRKKGRDCDVYFHWSTWPWPNLVIVNHTFSSIKRTNTFSS